MDTLLHVGLSNALLATVLALVTAGVCAVWRRPALAHGLWLLVLLKLVTPPLVPLSVPRLPGVEADAFILAGVERLALLHRHCEGVGQEHLSACRFRRLLQENEYRRRLRSSVASYRHHLE